MKILLSALLLSCAAFTAQAQPGYNFRSEQGLLTPLADYQGVSYINHSVADDQVGDYSQKLPFAFHIYGHSVDTVRISENGFIWFGEVKEGEMSVLNPISDDFGGRVTAVVSALGYDLHPHTDNNLTTIRSGIVGTAPYRMFIVEWANTSRIDPIKDGQLPDTLTFQIKLYETTQRIELVYGKMGINHDYIALTQVGIKGNNQTQFYNRMTKQGYNWNNTMIGENINSTCEFGTVYHPTFGQILAWEPSNVQTGINTIKPEYTTTTVFPNPSQTSINVTVPEGKYNFEIFNMNGQLVKKGSMQHTEPIQVSDIPPGYYQINTYMETITYRSRFLRN